MKQANIQEPEETCTLSNRNMLVTQKQQFLSQTDKSRLQQNEFVASWRKPKTSAATPEVTTNRKDDMSKHSLVNRNPWKQAQKKAEAEQRTFKSEKKSQVQFLEKPKSKKEAERRAQEVTIWQKMRNVGKRMSTPNASRPDLVDEGQLAQPQRAVCHRPIGKLLNEKMKAWEIANKKKEPDVVVQKPRGKVLNRKDIFLRRRASFSGPSESNLGVEERGIYTNPPPYTKVFVSRLAKEVTEEMVCKFVKEEFDVDVTCTPLNSKFDNTSFKSFAIYCPAGKKNILLDYERWPEGTLI